MVDLVSLMSQIRKCKKCEDLCRSRDRAVLGYGSKDAKIMVIGLAPGKDGANTTGEPFTRDASGNLLEHMLRTAGISRENDVYLTNIVKCNPKDDQNRNRKPTKKEMENCRSYLDKEVQLLKPAIVVPLGVMATELILEGKVKRMKDFNARIFFKDGMKIFPLFHPSFVIRGAYDKGLYRKDFKKLEKIVQQEYRKHARLTRMDLLLLLLYAPGPTGNMNEPIGGKTRLQKELFLAKKKLEEKGIRGLYSFRPYLHGPFSRELYNDIAWLISKGNVQENYLDLGDKGVYHTFDLTSKGVKKVQSLIDALNLRDIYDVVRNIKQTYNRMNLTALVEMTHRLFPEYLHSINSAKENQNKSKPPSKSPQTSGTIGLDRFLNKQPSEASK